jgi:hypothetical protein
MRPPISITRQADYASRVMYRSVVPMRGVGCCEAGGAELLCMLTQCHLRKLSAAQGPADERAGELQLMLGLRRSTEQSRVATAKCPGLAYNDFYFGHSG